MKYYLKSALNHAADRLDIPSKLSYCNPCIFLWRIVDGDGDKALHCICNNKQVCDMNNQGPSNLFIDSKIMACCKLVQARYSVDIRVFKPAGTIGRLLDHGNPPYSIAGRATNLDKLSSDIIQQYPTTE